MFELDSQSDELHIQANTVQSRLVGKKRALKRKPGYSLVNPNAKRHVSRGVKIAIE
jgi:hypothetical protein